MPREQEGQFALGIFPEKEATGAGGGDRPASRTGAIVGANSWGGVSVAPPASQWMVGRGLKGVPKTNPKMEAFKLPRRNKRH